MMCGLTFLHDPELSEPHIAERTQLALARLSYRGPDENGRMAGNGWAIGHRRLSIIDLESSHQPMASPDGRYHLAYNGEVYNYAELRGRLEGAWEFRTVGDTEVVLAGLILHGPKFLELMDGMWALALWDSHTQRLLLTRDRMGKKPLYYHASARRLVCASELPALRALDGAAWEEDLDSTADYLRYGYYLPGTTAYAGVCEVLPAHWLEWSPNEGVREKRYWSLPAVGFDGSQWEAQEQLRESLKNAVDRRLVADVEVGAFLSGGVDSSLVTALQTHRNGSPPKTFTIGFLEDSYDERRYARLVAARYDTDHHEEVLGHWDIEQLQQLILDHVGQPFADPSILPTSMVSKLAAKHVKVALSGDGGDELFSGYQRYQARAIMRWYTRLPPGMRRSAEKVLCTLPEPMAHHSRSMLKKMHLFLDAVRRVDMETPYIAPTMYTKDDFRELAPELINRGHQAPGIPDICDVDDIQRMMVADALIYLPQDILLKVDRASMANSLEVRTPFLDREVVELAFSLPRRWHRRRFAGKRMLQNSFSELLPSSIWRRRKQGFGVPVGQWFKEGLETELSRLLEETNTLLSCAKIKQMLKWHQDGRRDYGLRLWQLYVYLLWHEQFSGRDWI